jgi:SAM-dependent methyltransferase
VHALSAACVNALLLPNKIRANQIAEQIHPWLPANACVLDIGSGLGLVAQALTKRGAHISTIDTTCRSYAGVQAAQLYDGVQLPFATQSFAVALLITVLHHAHDPDSLLAEAARVARRVIVIEDLVETPSERFYTQLGDSWLNWQWRDHPHNNRSHAAWQTAYANFSLQITHHECKIHWFVPWRFRHGLYVLDPA